MLQSGDENDIDDALSILIKQSFQDDNCQTLVD